jgi:hypothetical protein
MIFYLSKFNCPSLEINQNAWNSIHKNKFLSIYLKNIFHSGQMRFEMEIFFIICHFSPFLLFYKRPPPPSPSSSSQLLISQIEVKRNLFSSFNIQSSRKEESNRSDCGVNMMKNFTFCCCECVGVGKRE